MQIKPVINFSLLKRYTRHAYTFCTTKAITALNIGESKFDKKNSPSWSISPKPNTNQWNPSATVNIVWTSSKANRKCTVDERDENGDPGSLSSRGFAYLSTL